MRAVRWIVPMLMAPALGPGGAWAQSATATLAGVVTDEGQAPLAGAQIVVSHELNGTERGATSGSDGRYSVSGIPAGGPYKLEGPDARLRSRGGRRPRPRADRA